MKRLILQILALFFVAQSAPAAVRTVYFNQVATNIIRDGLSAPANSTCRLTISNPSSTSQIVTLTNYTMSTATINPGTHTPAVVSGASPVTAGNSITWVTTYNSFPASTTGDQLVTCAGTFTATDSNPATPGFVIGTGMLVTFIESGNGEMQTSGATSSVTFNGMAVYTQVPITINRGQPF